MLSAGHDGKILLWNIISGEVLFSHQNTIDGQGFGAVFDAKWSSDGNMFAATDSHGQILTFSLGNPIVARKVRHTFHITFVAVRNAVFMNPITTKHYNLNGC